MDTTVYRNLENTSFEELLKFAIIDLQVLMVRGIFKKRGPRHARSLKRFMVLG